MDARLPTNELGGNTPSANPAVYTASSQDGEVIEKEWVDKAKAIVEQTRSKPYEEEVEVSDLQREYLKKRYGKEVGPGGS